MSMPKIADLAQAVADMSSRIAMVEIDQANHLEKLSRLQQTVQTTHGNAISALQESAKAISTEYCDLMESRHAELGRMMQRLIFKVTVLTEVAFAVRGDTDLSPARKHAVLQAAIYCLDLDDEFWHFPHASGLSVLEWAKRCLDEARAAQLTAVSKP